jgi:Tol biopolymer transport system component
VNTDIEADEADVRRELYSINPDGTGITPLVEDSADDRHPAWSPDGTQIVFSSTRTGRIAKIWTVDADGSNPAQLFELPGTNFGAYEPAWSPDGNRVAVHADAFGNFEIWVVDLTTDAPTRLTFSGDIDKEPAWSPDGTQLVYASRRGGFYDLYVLNPNDPNEQPTRLTNLAGDEERPAWSPDSSQIAFDASAGSTRQLYVMDADGANPVALTEGGEAGAPAWSPDGQWIAFAWDQDDTDSEIFIIRPDGTDLQQLTDNDWNDSAPDWLPAP